MRLSLYRVERDREVPAPKLDRLELCPWTGGSLDVVGDTADEPRERTRPALRGVSQGGRCERSRSATNRIVNEKSAAEIAAGGSRARGRVPIAVPTSRLPSTSDRSRQPFASVQRCKPLTNGAVTLVATGPFFAIEDDRERVDRREGEPEADHSR